MSRYATADDRDYLQSQIHGLRGDVMDVHEILCNKTDELQAEDRETRHDLRALQDLVESLAQRTEWLESEVEELDSRVDAMVERLDRCWMLMAPAEAKP